MKDQKIDKAKEKLFDKKKMKEHISIKEEIDDIEM